MALAPLYDRVCWRERTFGGLPRACSYQLHHLCNWCEWQGGLHMLSWAGRRNIARIVKCSNSSVWEKSQKLLQRLEWTRKFWLISWFKDGLGCKSVFWQYKEVERKIKLNLTAFNFCTLFSLQSKSSCHKICVKEVNHKAAIFINTSEGTFFFSLENSCFLLWVWTSIVKDLGFIL